MFYLLINLSYISFHFRGNSSIPLLDDVSLTVINNSMPIITFQSSHENSETYSDNSIKVDEKLMFFFEEYQGNRWLPKII